MGLPSSRVLLVLAGVVAVACAASGYTGFNLGRAAGDRLVRKMHEAGQAALKKHDDQAEAALDEYRETILSLSRRPARRVYCRPADSLPAPAGRAPSAGAGEPDRRLDGTDVGAGRDYGPALLAARDALVRCNALIKAVK